MTKRNTGARPEHNWQIGDLVQVKCFMMQDIRGDGFPVIDLRDPPEAMLIKGVVVGFTALEINDLPRPRLQIMLSTGDKVSWSKAKPSDTCVELVCPVSAGQ